MKKTVDLTGQKFGRLFVIERAPNRLNVVKWRCLCDCGKETIVSSGHIRKGMTKSCGCLLKENKTNLIHGKSKTQEYAIWWGMIGRCTNKNILSYKDYGALGVKVCSRWLKGENGKHGIDCFISDMGKRPSKHHSLDRFPNPRGDYAPDNCRWATDLEQANNKTNTRRIVYQGKEMSLCDAVRAAGSIIHREAAWIRIKTGWDVAKALETPRLFLSHASKEYKRIGRPDPNPRAWIAARHP